MAVVLCGRHALVMEMALLVVGSHIHMALLCV